MSQSRTQRLLLVAAALVVVVVAFVVLRPGSGGERPASTQPAGAAPANAPTTDAASPTATPEAAPVPTVRIVGGKPAGGVQEVSVNKGERIRLRVVSDVADEIHVHGYDLKKDVAAGGSARFSFPATIDGRFEVELEHAGQQIATLEVNP
jgi:FtsP/CotA-like multicopper oxidase with cupredoxin domain